MLKIRQLLATAAICGLVLVTRSSAQSTLTQIRDTVYNADGTLFNGTVIITWNGYASSTGTTIAPYSTSARIYNGALSVLLVPTTTASGAASYQAVYNSKDGTVTWTETWSVPPSTTALTLSAIRTSTTAGSGSGGTGSTGSGGTGSGAGSGSGSGGGGGISGTGASGTVSLPISISDVSGLSDALSGLTSSETGLTSSVANLTAIVNGLSATVNSTTTVTGLTATVNSLSSTVSGLSTTVSGQASTLASLGTSVTGLTTTVNGLSSSYSTINSNLTGLTSTVNTQGTTLSGLSTTVSGLSGTVTGQGSTLSTLGTTVTGLSNTVASHTATLAGLNTTVSGLSSTVSTQGTTLSALNTTVTGLSSTSAAQATTLSALNTTVTGLNGTVTTQGNTLSSLGTTVNGLSSSVTSLTATVNSLSSGNTSVAYVDADATTGTLNGTNANFTLLSTPYPTSSLEVYRNGLVQTAGLDYTLSGKVITFTTGNIPISTDTLSTFYRTTGTSMSSVFADAETPTGNVNGTNAAYTLAATPNPATSLRLFKNGMLLAQGSDYTLSGANITIATAVILQTGDKLLAYYRH